MRYRDGSDAYTDAKSSLNLAPTLLLLATFQTLCAGLRRPVGTRMRYECFRLQITILVQTTYHKRKSNEYNTTIKSP